MQKFNFFKKFIFYIILKVTLHLQLLQNIGYMPRVVQYILVAYLTTPNSLYLPLPHPYVAPLPLLAITSLFSVSVSLLLFCYIH